MREDKEEEDARSGTEAKAGAGRNRGHLRVLYFISNGDTSREGGQREEKKKT